MIPLQARTLLQGKAASADTLVLSAPISFWGGVDPKTGIISDVRHPDLGKRITDTALCLPGTIGSCSGAAILLELVHTKLAPAALVLHEPDAILLLGLIVAREMGYATPPAFQLDRGAFAALPDRVSITPDGMICEA